MTFSSIKYDIRLELDENSVNVLVIEPQSVYSEIISGLYYLSGQNSGDFVLAEKDRILNFGKTAEIIANPFTTDCNERRITQKLYHEIEERVNEEMTVENAQIHSVILDYLEKALMTVPYNIEFNIEQDITALLKAYNVKICDDGMNVTEKLVNYMRVLHKLCGICLFVFINLKTFLSEDELASLYEFSFYEKIHLLLLENSQKNRLQGEKIFILDKDRCIIKID